MSLNQCGKIFITLYIVGTIVCAILGGVLIGVGIDGTHKQWYEQTPMVWVGVSFVILFGLLFFGGMTYACIYEETTALVWPFGIATVVLCIALGTTLTLMGVNGPGGQQVPGVFWSGISLLIILGLILITSFVYGCVFAF